MVNRPITGLPSDDSLIYQDYVHEHQGELYYSGSTRGAAFTAALVVASSGAGHCAHPEQQAGATIVSSNTDMPSDEVPVSSPLTPESFDADFAAVANSPTLRAISQRIYGSEYPADAEPFSFVTVTDLNQIARSLAIGAGDTILDLCCGRGGPGLWVARATGASLIGIDFSPIGVAHAKQAAQRMKLADRTRFEIADACATGLADGSCDAAMSIDALQLLPDRAATLREVARVLRAGARFAFTTWEIDPHTPAGDPSERRFVRDHTPLLEAAGFRVESREQTPNSQRYEREFFEGILANRDQLVAEMGESVTAGMCDEANSVLPNVVKHRRVLLIASRAV